MPRKRLSKHSAKIKDVYVELKNYEFFHSPYEREGKERFIGRQEIKNRIVSILEKTKIKSGSYLITGFRGMGKTSIIREAIEIYNGKIKEEKPNSIKNFLTPIPNLRFIKRFIGYSFLFLFLLILLFIDNKYKPNQLTIIIPFIIICFLQIYFALFDPSNYYQNKNLIIKSSDKISKSFQPFLYYIYTIFLFFSMQVVVGLQPLYFSLLSVYFIFLISNFQIFVGNQKIANAAWNFYKLVILTLGFSSLTLYFYNYQVFCKHFARICITTEEVYLVDYISSEKDIFPNYVKIIMSLIISYCIISLIYFIVDFIAQVCITVKNNLAKKTRSSRKKYEGFEINLSLESLNEMDVLRRITIQLEEYWIKNKLKLSRPLFDRKIYFLWKILLRNISTSQSNPDSPTYESVLIKLQTLKNRMSGEVTSRKELKLNPNITTGIKNGLTRVAMPLGIYSNKDEINYPIANSKEAEDQLKSIFDDIDKIRDMNEWDISKFIFIIDELDKIEPYNNSNIQDREISDPILDNNAKTRDPNHYRRRQETVAKLLSNLKGFLNVVRAKFFFIGGREMYDAALADISDRDSFYSSIFNDVIYVDSFFKDSTDGKHGKGGVTQMTEAYLCNIILDSKEETLKSLYEQLNFSSCQEEEEDKPTKECSLFFDSCTDKSHDDQLCLTYDELKKQAYKVIFLLQNYIIYLTYRSNGTPKKLTALTEKLIVSGPEYREERNKEFIEENVVIFKDKKNPLKEDLSKRLFLKFGFNTQYEIGLTANLYRPYLIANSRHLKSLGDKLLFSSSFIIDHILKFHPFSFSWRNLELIPEVVLVNREPNLRKFIEDLMRFYSMTYIRNTVSGIFDYTFRSIVKRELIYLSKTSDLSSAAFNFTLDESLSIKRHYKRKLSELQHKYKSYLPKEKDNLYIHSLGFIQTILGDLHFYDKEYDESIVFYTESIQALRLPNAVTDRYLTRHQFLLWLKNQLKLGLALEKIRAFDSAFSLYKTLTLDTERYLKIIVSQKKKTSPSKNMSESEDHRTIQLLSMPFVAFLAVIEKVRTDGITLTNLIRNQEEFLRTVDPSIESLNPKFSDKIDSFRRCFLKADYYNNAGSVLFYKNYHFSELFNNDNSPLLQYDKDCYNYIQKQLQEQYSKVKSKNEEQKREYDFSPSLAPFTYYWNSLYFLLSELRDEILKQIKLEGIKLESTYKTNLLSLSTAILLPNCIDLASNNRLYYMANVISKIGDSILASLKKEDFYVPENKFDFLDINAPLKNIEKKRVFNIKKFNDLINNNELYSIETTLYTYKLAAALFKRAGHNSYYASHLMKMLYAIKDLIEVNKVVQENGEHKISFYRRIIEHKNKIENFLNIDIKNLDFTNIENVAIAVFKATTWNNLVSNRPQILKYRNITGLANNKYKDREIFYNNINNTSDNREALILVEGIKMKLGKLNNDKFIEKFDLSKSIISTYGTISNRYLRMLELKYRSERCYFLLKHIFDSSGLLSKKLETPTKPVNEIISPLKKIITNHDNLSFLDIIIFLLKEALFCLQELIKMINLYDPGYVIGYSFIAEAHNRMGSWCLAYENLNIILGYEFNDKQNLNVIDKIKQQREDINASTKLKTFIIEIKKLLGSESLTYLESKSHYEAALQYYYKVIQLHSGGKTYREKVHEIYMLEDDYNDMTAHYTIASERLRINTGAIKNKIDFLNKKITDSKLYSYDSYLFSEAPNDQHIPDVHNIKFYLDFFKNSL